MRLPTCARRLPAHRRPLDPKPHLDLGVRPVRELMGIVASEGATGGIIVSTSTFTRGARRFADASSIQLIDGQQVLHRVRRHQVNPPELLDAGTVPANRPVPETAAAVSPTPACPKCGPTMVRRTAKRGAHQGQAFWGCTQYPACRGTLPG